MSISFAAQPAAVKIRRPNSTDEFVTGGDGHDWVFDLYGVERDKALILNEHELVWVELNRVHVLLNEPQPDADPGELEISETSGLMGTKEQAG